MVRIVVSKIKGYEKSAKEIGNILPRVSDSPLIFFTHILQLSGLQLDFVGSKPIEN